MQMKESAKKLKIVYPFSYNPVLEYYNWIEHEFSKGHEVVSDKVRKVYAHIVDIMNDTESEWEYDSQKANHALEFIENICRQSKGAYGGHLIKLELWQKAFVAALFGFVNKKTRLRKYREAALFVGRKNGKSTLGSAIGLYLMIGDNEPGAEIYAVATKKDQAKIIWQEAKRMVGKSRALSKRIRRVVGEMTADFNDSSFRALGRDSERLDGLNVHGALLDEIHAWDDDNMYDVINDGTSSRLQPLVLIFTTAGTVREHIYDKKYEEYSEIIKAYENQESDFADERILPVIYELDKREEWKDQEKHIKANPGLGTIKDADELARKVRKAIADPRKQKNLLCKDFNIPETVAEAWLTRDEIYNAELFDKDSLPEKPEYGIGGADLSDTTDLTAAKVMFKIKGSAKIYIESMYWLPEDKLETHVKDDKIRYDLWYEQGYLRLCKGNQIKESDVTEWFLEIAEKYNIYILWIGYDAWGSKYWKTEMETNFGTEAMIPVRQGAYTFSLPMKKLQAELQAKHIIYNKNPIDIWCMSNTAIETDKNENIRPIKTRNPRKRIDGMLALIDIFVIYENKKTEYESLIS